MKSSTSEEGLVFDLGSLYAYLQSLHNKRKPRGVRYQLVTILVLIVMAKLCEEDQPCGIVDRAKHRSDMLSEWLKLKRKQMPHHSTYQRILGERIYKDPLNVLLPASPVFLSSSFSEHKLEGSCRGYTTFPKPSSATALGI